LILNTLLNSPPNYHHGEIQVSSVRPRDQADDHGAGHQGLPEMRIRQAGEAEERVD